MSIAKPFTFVANTYAKASEVNANFDTVYSQVNSNISQIAQNATDIESLENNKADINGSTAQRFAVADAISNGDAINKQTLFKQIANSLDFISGLIITKDSGSPEDTIIVSAGSAYDSTHAVVLNLNSSTSKQNLNQGASATYYVYIIGSATGSSVDILISTSSTTPTLPSGYTLFRLIGSYTTDADSKINSISYYGISSTEDKGAGGIFSSIEPDHTARISFSQGEDYTCPSAGWVYAFVKSVEGAGNGSITINGVTYTSNTSSGGYVDSCLITVLVNQGDVVKITSAQTATIYFIPAKGVE